MATRVATAWTVHLGPLGTLENLVFQDVPETPVLKD